MSALVDVGVRGPDEIVDRLLVLFRPDFNVAVFQPDPDDPVLAGRRCGVSGCDRPGRSRRLCAAHHRALAVRPVLAMIARSGAESLLDRPLDD